MSNLFCRWFVVPKKHWKSRVAILTTLGMLGAIHLPVLTNIKVLAQTPSSQLTVPQCTDLEIQNHIQQLEKGDITAFNTLVICASTAVPALISTLNNPDENIRIMTIAALGEIGIRAAPAVPALKVFAKDQSVEVRVVTVNALGKIRKHAVSTLIQALQDKNEEVRATARNALIKIGKPAIPRLIDALLLYEDELLRLEVEYVLGEMGADAKQAVPALIRTGGKAVELSDGCDGSYQALVDIGNNALPALNTALKDKNWSVRAAAVYVLGVIASLEDALPKLTKVLLDENEDTRVRFIAKELLYRYEVLEMNSEAAAVLKRHQKTVDIITRNSQAINFDWPPGCATAVADLVGQATVSGVSAKPPVICKIPALRALLRWKCPK